MIISQPSRSFPWYQGSAPVMLAVLPSVCFQTLEGITQYLSVITISFPGYKASGRAQGWLELFYRFGIAVSAKFHRCIIGYYPTAIARQKEYLGASAEVSEILKLSKIPYLGFVTNIELEFGVAS